MKTILITGASGFIGQKLINCCFTDDNLITLSRGRGTLPIFKTQSIHIQGDITDNNLLENVCNKYRPDFVIHCAGIAHQKIGNIDFDEYLRVNSYASESLAKASLVANPDVHFLFLSSISVYGEENIDGFISEEDECNPSSDYADSKLDAEKRLVKLYNAGELKKLDLLRLAPVYDSDWSLNLERRVFAPGKTAYIKFGSGEQKMSAVARSNLVEFIEFIVKKQYDPGERYCNILNVCDEQPYSFKEIIKTFKQSKYQPDRVVITIPLFFVWILTRLAGLLWKNKKKWLYSCYNKLARSLIFNNRKMLDTGFKPAYTLTSVLNKDSASLL